MIFLNQILDVSPDALPIYKIFGSLASEYRHSSADALPITEYDHRKGETEARIHQFLEKLMVDIQEGNHVLLLCPSQWEVKQAHILAQSIHGAGLIWMISSEFSDEEQDFHRKTGIRVLPNDPADLLSAFSTLLLNNHSIDTTY